MLDRETLALADELPGHRLARAVEALAQGRPVVIADDDHREGESDLILPAQFADERWIALMIRRTSGIICCAAEGALLDALELPLMVEPPGDPHRTAFTVSVDAASGIGTGISAADRARTLRVLADPSSRPTDLVRPGHIFPLRAHADGMGARRGHTEAAIALMQLAGLRPAAVLSELVEDDGTVSDRSAGRRFAASHGLEFLTVDDIVNRRPAVMRLAHAQMPTRYGEFRAEVFAAPQQPNVHHLALICGDPRSVPAPLVRIHSECLTGESFDSRRCDCASQLRHALSEIATEGAGVVVYLRGHEGRGIGLVNKLRAYERQDAGADTVDANVQLGLPVDARTYDAAAEILRALDVRQLRLLTNNPDKIGCLRAHGLGVERAEMPTFIDAENEGYVCAKVWRLGHFGQMPAQIA
jgi:3,4-dihydroxy 2-butanone 4-phosphate synthase/GTP cyclohydrolase II